MGGVTGQVDQDVDLISLNLCNDLLVGLATAIGSFISGLIFAAMGYGLVGAVGVVLALIPIGMTLWWQIGQRRLAVSS